MFLTLTSLQSISFDEMVIDGMVEEAQERINKQVR